MILRRYMTRQVASTTALVLGFLLLLLLGGRMIRYFGIAAEGRLDVGLLFAIIGYNLPYFLELVLPLSFFIGLMLIFGRLYVDHEMAVLNGSGISRGRLARLMIPLILVLFVFEAGVSMFAKPWGVKNSESIWQQQSLSSAFDLIRPKSFINSDDYHLYVGSMNEDRTELQDVILIQTAEDRNSKNSDNLIGEASVKSTSTEESSDTLNGNEVNDNAKASHANSSSEESNKVSTPQNKVLERSKDGSPSSPKDLKDDEAITALTNPVAAAQNNSNTAANDKANELINQTAEVNANVNGDEGDSNSDSSMGDVSQRDIIVLAKRAVQVQGTEDNARTQLDLYQGRRYEVGADSLVYNQISFERYRISINKPPADVITEDNVTTQSLPVLWQAATGKALPIMAQDKTSDVEIVNPLPQTPNEQQVKSAQGELGYRLALPWLILIAPMLAVPLAQVRPRQGRWLRLLPAIIIFTSCALVIISLKSAVTKGSMPVWSYPLVILSFMIFALYLNWASRIHHRVRFRLGQRKNIDETNNGGQL